MLNSSYLGETLALITAVSWALAVIFYRLAGQHLTPIAYTLFKSLITILLLLLTLVFLDQSIDFSAWTPVEFLLIAASGILGVTLGDVLYVASVNRIGAGMTSIIDCLYTPLMVFFAATVFSESLSGPEIFGGCLVLGSVLMIGIMRDSHPDFSNPEFKKGIFLGVVAQLCMVLAIVTIKNLLNESSLLPIMTLRYIIGTAPLLLFLSKKQHREDFKTAFRFNRVATWSIAGTLLGSYISTLAWFGGFQYEAAGRIAILHQSSTAFLILFATLLLKEKITLLRFAAISLALSGALIVVLS